MFWRRFFYSYPPSVLSVPFIIQIFLYAFISYSICTRNFILISLNFLYSAWIFVSEIFINYNLFLFSLETQGGQSLKGGKSPVLSLTKKDVMKLMFPKPLHCNHQNSIEISQISNTYVRTVPQGGGPKDLILEMVLEELHERVCKFRDSLLFYLTHFQYSFLFLFGG